MLLQIPRSARSPEPALGLDPRDNGGNLLTDGGSDGSKAYTYNKRNRLSVATVGALTYTYTYNALEQLSLRVQSSPAATTHFIHDRMGNVIASR